MSDNIIENIDENDIDSDNDSYYDRLEQQALDNNDSNEIYDNQIINNTNNEILDEDSYYNAISELSTQFNDTFLSEDHSIWQEIELINENQSHNIFYPVDINNLSILLVIKQWLMNSLPISSGMYGHICDIITSLDNHDIGYHKDDNIYIYVDSYTNPLVIIMFYLHPSYEEEDIDIRFYSSINFNKLYDNNYILIINKFIQIYKKQRNKNVTIMYSKLDHRSLEIIERVMTSVKCKQTYYSPCAIYTYTKPLPSIHVLPEDYEYSELTINDAMIINDTWAYKTLYSYKHVIRLIHKYPSIGIRYKDNSLVCWYLTYDYGAMGMLYTLPEHRNKGLGIAITTALLSKWDINTIGCAPFVYIASKNKTSQDLYTKLGYEKQSEQYWLGYTYNDAEEESK